jgi:hypothetical protein
MPGVWKHPSTQQVVRTGARDLFVRGGMCVRSRLQSLAADRLRSSGRGGDLARRRWQLGKVWPAEAREREINFPTFLRVLYLCTCDYSDKVCPLPCHRADLPSTPLPSEARTRLYKSREDPHRPLPLYGIAAA